MKFSIIVPSYNQDKYIEETLKNLVLLKERAKQNNIEVEVLLFDSESNQATQVIIDKYQSLFDYKEIKKDFGQYDAINKGIKQLTGDYWTWLNTDDCIELDGFFKMVDILKSDNSIDYIYGGIRLVDEAGKVIRVANARKLTKHDLVNNVAGIYQPGSFFKKSFTDNIGYMVSYECCFDYEYVIRALNGCGKFYVCNFEVAIFRIHESGKTSKKKRKFVLEQLYISKQYGRRFLSKFTFIAYLRVLKHTLFN